MIFSHGHRSSTFALLVSGHEKNGEGALDNDDLA
jgi:hypothetical protein